MLGMPTGTTGTAVVQGNGLVIVMPWASMVLGARSGLL